MAIFTPSRFLFSMGVAIFLVFFFAPDEVVTIFIQTMYFFVLLWHIVTNIIVVFLATIVFVFVSLISTGVDFIPNTTPNTVLIIQSSALQGFDEFFLGYENWIRDVADVFESLLGVEISYVAGQSWEQALDITVTGVWVSFEKTVSGVGSFISEFMLP